LLIRDSKGKDRIIPVSKCTATQITSYMKQRDKHLERRQTDCMIISSSQGTALSLASAQTAFIGYRCILLGRGEVWRRRPPRLYDFRHTFACQTILRWYKEGENINACLPLLATYLGHATITETYWYLTGTPELMEMACEAFGEMALGEVDFDEIE
jgi:integrase